MTLDVVQAVDASYLQAGERIESSHLARSPGWH